GTLDFSKDVSELKFTAHARKVDLRQFTRKWNMPKQIRDMGGRLTGDADLVVTIGDRVHVNGRGDGRIEGADVLGEKTTVGLKLRYIAGRPQFSSEMSSSSLRLPQRWTALAPIVAALRGQTQPTEEPAAPRLIEYPAWAVSWLQKGVSYAGHAVTEAGKTVVKYFPDAKRAKETGKTTYLEVSFSLKDIDLAQLVKRTGVKLPFPVSGRGTLQF